MRAVMMIVEGELLLAMGGVLGLLFQALPGATKYKTPSCSTSKVSRQVLRFFKHCFPKPASPALYERELRPMLMAYL